MQNTKINMEKNTGKNSNKIQKGFMPLSEASKRTGYTPEHLNLLCRQGKLKGKKIGRNWFVKKEWLDNFILNNETNRKGGGAAVVKIREKLREPVLGEGSLKIAETKKNRFRKCNIEYSIPVRRNPG